MSRDWKPGDIVLIDLSSKGLESRRAMREGNAFVDVCGAVWSDDANVRPLVVIDPEDRDQVERLASAFVDEQSERGHRGVWWTDLQVALRSLLEQPNPDEPTGLGAIVEDVTGEKWIRGTARIADFDWINADDFTRSRAYRNIAAVRVLSEGVTP